MVHRVNVVYAIMRSECRPLDALPDRAVGTPDELLDAMAWLQRTARTGEQADTRQHAAVLLAEFRLHFSV
jgi:hypothetical protein